MTMKRNDLPGSRKIKRVRAWGRVKTACITALLVCNVLLLAVLGCVKGYDMVLAHRTRIQMDAMLAQKGILCGSSVYHTLADCPQAYTLRADSAVQRAFAEALLTGTVTSGAGKGNTMVWTGENGTVSWAASGDVSAEVGLYSIPEPQTIEQAQSLVKNLLEDAGIPVRDDQISTEQLDTGFEVEVRQQIDKMELLGCSLTVTIAPGNETTIMGKWCTGEAQPLTVRALESYSPQQMIFQLVASQDSLAQIISAQPVCVLSDKSGGRFTAIPCWRFSTDSGDYVLNILTGDVVASADLDASISESIEQDWSAELDRDFNDTSDLDAGDDADDEWDSEWDTGAGDAMDTDTDAAMDEDTDDVSDSDKKP